MTYLFTDRAVEETRTKDIIRKLKNLDLSEFGIKYYTSFISFLCTAGQKKKKTKHPYLFQYKLSYRNETGTSHHGFVYFNLRL